MAISLVNLLVILATIILVKTITCSVWINYKFEQNFSDQANKGRKANKKIDILLSWQSSDYYTGLTSNSRRRLHEIPVYLYDSSISSSTEA